MAMPRSDGGAWLMSRSPIQTSPSDRVSSPAIMRSRVDLPHPEGPTNTTHSPSRMSRSTSCRTASAPNRLPTPRSRTFAMLLLLGRAWGGLAEPVRHPVGMLGEQRLDEIVDLVEIEFGGGVRIEHGGVMDMFALAGDKGFHRQRLDIDVGLHQGCELRRDPAD